MMYRKITRRRSKDCKKTGTGVGGGRKDVKNGGVVGMHVRKHEGKW